MYTVSRGRIVIGLVQGFSILNINESNCNSSTGGAKLAGNKIYVFIIRFSVDKLCSLPVRNGTPKDKKTEKPVLICLAASRRFYFVPPETIAIALRIPGQGRLVPERVSDYETGKIRDPLSLTLATFMYLVLRSRPQSKLP